MTSVRRFLVLQSLMLWQGGFLFYAAVVVPAGTEALGSAMAQGAITSRVTSTMNHLAILTLAVLALDLRLSPDNHKRRTELRWWCWCIALLCQGLLFYFHLLLISLMAPDLTRVIIWPPFRPVHRMYLWTISIQWGTCLLYAWLTLRAWRSEDVLAIHVANMKS